MYEYIILNSYRKNVVKSQNKKFFDNKTFFEKILFLTFALLIFLFIIYFLYSGSNSDKDLIIFKTIAIPLIIDSILILHFTRKRDVIDSDEDFNSIKDHYENVNDWLIKTEFDKKQKIIKLCQRCNLLIKKIEYEQIETIMSFRNLFGIIVVPTYLAILTKMLNNIELTQIVLNSVAFMTILIGVIYFTGKVIIKEIKPYFDTNYRDMVKMRNDIRGVLDTKFNITNEDIYNININEIWKSWCINLNYIKWFEDGSDSWDYRYVSIPYVYRRNKFFVFYKELYFYYKLCKKYA